MSTRLPLQRCAPRALPYLRRADKRLTPIFAKVGPLKPNFVPDRFAALAYSIISQQISTKAADSIRARVVKLAGRNGLTAAAVLRLPEAELRAAGLSGQKVTYLKDLATHVDAGLRLDELHDAADETIIEQLTAVKGIGRWTAEMFLIFSLGRVDVLPVDDLGLRTAIRRLDGMRELPTKAEVRERGVVWKPYSSVATWYLWQSLKYPETPELSVRARRLDINQRQR